MKGRQGYLICCLLVYMPDKTESSSLSMDLTPLIPLSLIREGGVGERLLINLFIALLTMLLTYNYAERKR